ncbi:dTDP-glucose 4,6-dehydratase [Nocardiopsis halophila]|uniref:dTDP-glucose 4,6-dehydratase n=1 Tax=Nocardiopsis halophila TaxID=141692 RepID=UPI00034A91B1|nr:dTDP-glucose 4,6-dehydratase [Nocardiopsis halophila]
MTLVTGGAGFIGSHFVRALLSGEYPELDATRVSVLDCLGYAGNRVNLASVADDPRLDFVEGDIRDPVAVDTAMRGHRLVVHFAAETHVDRSIPDSGPFVQANVVGTQSLLSAALRHGVERFVQVSTDEVYGSTSTGSFVEEDPLRPSSPYAASKAAGDLMAQCYHRTHGMDVVVTRGSNTYGPFQYPEKIIPRFVTRLLNGGTVPLYGDGANVRDWLYVDDHCRGVALAAARGRSGGVYHVGGGVELTNAELTSRLLELYGLGWDRVEYVDDRKGHDRRYSLDTTATASELGYAPRQGIDEGLEATARWYADNRDWWEAIGGA